MDDLADDMVDLDMCEYDNVHAQARKLALRKNHDYGCVSLKSFNGLGMMSKLYDKAERFQNIYAKNQRLVLDESLEDTFIDIINYATYCIMYSRGKLEKASRGDHEESA